MPEYNKDAANGCLGWDDVIEDDDKRPVILEAGDYTFTVRGCERGHFPGSAKLPACNKATVTLEVKAHEGTVIVRTDLFLHQSMEWKISDFFCSIGLKKRGEPLRMAWDKTPGRRGRAHFKVRTYTGRDGNEYQTNDVHHFYDWEEKYFTAAEARAPKFVDEDDLLPFE